MILTSMKKYSDAILQFRKANDVSSIIYIVFFTILYFIMIEYI